jgi:hypothetical protein
VNCARQRGTCIDEGNKMTLREFLLLLAVPASCAAAAPPAPTVGESWTFEAHDGYQSSKRQNSLYRVDVTAVTGSKIATRVTSLGDGLVTSECFDRNWNPVSADWMSSHSNLFYFDFPNVPDRLLPGVHWEREKLSNQPLVALPGIHPYAFSPPYPELPAQLEPGVSWSGETVAKNDVTGRSMRIKVTGKVAGHERVRVPAGEFDTLRIDRVTYLDDENDSHSPTRVTESEWYAPAVGRSIKYSTKSEYYEKVDKDGPQKPVPGEWTIYELVAYRGR